MPLTDVQIKRLKPRTSRYAVSDGRGLALKVMPSGAASWGYRYQFKGKTEKVSLRQYSMLSLKEARTKRDEMAVLVFRGESPARQKQLEKVALANASTVRDFCERYFAEVIQKDRKDATQLRRYLEKETYPAFGSVSMREETAQDVQRLVFRKRDNGFDDSGATPQSVETHLRLRRRLWVGDDQSRTRHPDSIHYTCPT